MRTPALKDVPFRRAILPAAALLCALAATAQTDSTALLNTITNAAPEEAIKLTAKGSFLSEHAGVGDTIEYQLLVQWQDSRIPVVVLAPDSLETPGFRVADQSATHRKVVENGEARNTTEFLYKLVARTQGAGRVSALKLRYLTGFSNREEALYVPGAFMDIGPEHIPLWKRLWFQLILGIILLAGVIWSGFRLSRSLSLSKGRRNAQNSKQRDFSPEVKGLKGRWNTADSRSWIEDSEKICLEFLRYHIGTAGTKSSETTRFETLLDQYLIRHPNPQEAEGWNKLRELFHHARYAGGRKEPHELQDTYRILKTCLHIQGENE